MSSFRNINSPASVDVLILLCILATLNVLGLFVKVCMKLGRKCSGGITKRVGREWV